MANNKKIMKGELWSKRMSRCNYAIKCRIYPNDSQIVMIEKTFGCVRKIWNLMLNDRNNVYKKDKISRGHCQVKDPAKALKLSIYA